MPSDTPGVIPMLTYEDGCAALDWLARAFGFRERARLWSRVPWVIDGVLVYVADVDAHDDRAKREGALILSEPEDGPPARRYRAVDLEGHRWMFMQR